MFKKSVHSLEVALTWFMKMYGKESSPVAIMLNYLGGTYLRWGRYQKSKYATKIIAI